MKSNNINTSPESNELYKGYNLISKKESKDSDFYTTLIYKNGSPVGGCFSGPLDQKNSVEKAKVKVDNLTK